jgi:four helix bundle protein
MWKNTVTLKGRATGMLLAAGLGMSEDLKRRTKAFALAILKLARELDHDVIAVLLRPQLVRAGSGVASNYRAACRAKSPADFIAKLTTAEEESDESALWLDVLADSQCVPRARIEVLLDEADQLTAILVASIRTARGKR